MTDRQSDRSTHILEGIYETHLEVSALETSIEFYENLGLTLRRVEDDQRVAFLYIEATGRSMIGLWETDDVDNGPDGHFAFRVPETNVDEMDRFLTDRGPKAHATFGVEPGDQPLVHPWTATASMYSLIQMGTRSNCSWTFQTTPDQSSDRSPSRSGA